LQILPVSALKSQQYIPFSVWRKLLSHPFFPWHVSHGDLSTLGVKSWPDDFDGASLTPGMPPPLTQEKISWIRSTSELVKKGNGMLIKRIKRSALHTALFFHFNEAYQAKPALKKYHVVEVFAAAARQLDELENLSQSSLLCAVLDRSISNSKPETVSIASLVSDYKQNHSISEILRQVVIHVNKNLPFQNNFRNVDENMFLTILYFSLRTFHSKSPKTPPSEEELRMMIQKPISKIPCIFPMDNFVSKTTENFVHILHPFFTRVRNPSVLTLSLLPPSFFTRLIFFNPQDLG